MWQVLFQADKNSVICSLSYGLSPNTESSASDLGKVVLFQGQANGGCSGPGEVTNQLIYVRVGICIKTDPWNCSRKSHLLISPLNESFVSSLRCTDALREDRDVAGWFF